MSQHRRIIELTATRNGVVAPQNTTQSSVTTQTTTAQGSSLCPVDDTMLMQPPASLQIPSVQSTPPIAHPTTSTEDEIHMAKSTQISTNEQTAIYLAAGAAAGIMEHCVMFPIDSVKVSYNSCCQFYLVIVCRERGPGTM